MPGRSGFLQLALAMVWLLKAAAVGAQGAGTNTSSQSDLPDLSIEDLLNLKVYAASRYDQEIGRAPASVSIITADEIRTHGYRTLADALRSVRGFYVSYDRNYSYIGVRGFERPGDYNGRILLLVNGHQLNDTIFEEALLGTESPIDLALIERIEVVRGPSSSLYGTSAFFGVVNLITRRGGSMSGVEIEGQAGSLLSRSVRASVGGKSAGWETLFSASALASRGNEHLYYPAFDAADTNHGVASDADADQSASVFASASGHGFDLQGAFGSRSKVVPTAAFGTVFNDPRTRTRDARGFADALYTHAYSATTTAHARLSFDEYDYDGHYAYDTGLFRDGANASWITGGADFVRLFERHTFTSGLEIRDNLRQNQHASNETGLLLDDRRGSRTAAVYAQDEFRLSSSVLVNGGLRWDHYFNTFGTTINPRVGLIVSPSPDTSVKVLYGRAFRAPNPYELYYEGDPISAALKPERITTQEVVWEQRMARRVHVTTSLFHNRATNLINQVNGSTSSLDGLYFDNSQQVRATGFELELNAEFPRRLHLRVADAVQSAVDAADDSRLSNSPSQVGFVVVDAPLARSGFVAALNTWLIGTRSTVNGAAVPASVVTDFTLSRRSMNDRLAVALTVRNLFDVAYSDPGSAEHREPLIPQDGRTVALRAIWQLR